MMNAHAIPRFGVRGSARIFGGSIQRHLPLRLYTSTDRYGVPIDDAFRFLRIRTHCTGFHTVATISHRTDVPLDELMKILDSLEAVNLFYPEGNDLELVDSSQAQEVLIRAVDLWACEMQWTFLGRELLVGGLNKNTVIGWLLEAYHEARELSEALDAFVHRVANNIRSAIAGCVAQWADAKSYILASLGKLGLSEREVETSVPLLATRLVGFLVRELFELEPVTALMVLSIFTPDIWLPMTSKR